MEAMPVKHTRKHLTKKEKADRAEAEERLKGKELSPTPPSDLNESQQAIYKWLYAQCSSSNLLSGKDLVTMKNACIIIDRLDMIDRYIDSIDDISQWTKATNLRNTYFNQYLKVCRELCLSPTARGRMGSIESSSKKDPLLEALGNA